MKATLFIRKDHEIVNDLFEKFRKSKISAQNGKRGVFNEIRKELTMHSNVETELFYPELRMSTSERAENLVQAATQEHERIEKLLDEIASITNNDKQFETRVLELIDIVNAHVHEEEESILPEARETLSEQRLEELGLEMEARKRILMQIAA
jgi:hemerythrin superfamily protein